jgi:adenine-specific DNA-methyltransferase
MTRGRPQIELVWEGKGASSRVSSARLVEARARRCGMIDHDDDAPANRLIHGDNVDALFALADELRGRVACVYLDPPYNTGNTFTHYDDDVAHARWLSSLRDVLVAVKPLLADTGVVVAQIDRNEAAYLKVLLDEVFGRRAYVTTIAVRMSATSGFKIEHTDKTIVKNAEFVHVYARDLVLHEKAFEESLAFDDHYAYVLADDRRSFARLAEHPDVRALFAAEALSPTSASLPELYRRSAAFRAFVVAAADRICRTHTAPAPARDEHARGTLFRNDAGVGDDDDVGCAVVERTHGGTSYLLRRTRTGVDQLIPLSLKLNRVDGTSGPDRLAITNILGDWWDGFHLDMGNVDDEGGVGFKNSKKPERLLRRILRMFTRPGDVVVDPFCGSGTTPAVAHKMRRRWIAIEAGDHCLTHALPRLQRVVAGVDTTGVTAAEGWSGGGGFRVFRVASSTKKKAKATTTTPKKATRKATTKRKKTKTRTTLFS